MKWDAESVIFAILFGSLGLSLMLLCGALFVSALIGG